MSFIRRVEGTVVKSENHVYVRSLSSPGHDYNTNNADQSADDENVLAACMSLSDSIQVGHNDSTEMICVASLFGTYQGQNRREFNSDYFSPSGR